MFMACPVDDEGAMGKAANQASAFPAGQTIEMKRDGSVDDLVVGDAVQQDAVALAEVDQRAAVAEVDGEARDVVRRTRG